MTASTTRSVQPTYWFHSRTMAAMKAMNGTTAPMRLESLCARVMAWMVPVTHGAQLCRFSDSCGSIL